jgi:hypothetical protein
LQGSWLIWTRAKVGCSAELAQNLAGWQKGWRARGCGGCGDWRSLCDGDDQTLAKVAEDSAESEIPKANTQNVLAKQQAG